MVFLSLIPFFNALAQRSRQDEEAAKAAAGCAACGGTFLAIIIGIIALNIALLVWVARDSKARGMGNSVGWMALVLFTGVLGLVIYWFSRPVGNVVMCQSCKNKKLEAMSKCPHCGN